MIPIRQKAPEPLPPKESIPHRLARLRSEQTPRTRFNSSSSSSSSSSTTRQAAAWLRPVTRPSTRSGYPRRGTAGPPPPPSWTQAAAPLSPLPTTRNLKPRQLVQRKRLAEPLVTRQDHSKGGGGTRAVESLFNLSSRTISRDLSLGPTQSILLPHVYELVPTHLKLRLIEAIADWRNPVNLTNSGAVELLRIDHARPPHEDEEEHDGDEEQEWDRESDEGLERLSLNLDDNALPISTCLTRLNLSFSSVNLKTLRRILLRPSSSSSSSSSSKMVSNFPHLESLILVSTRRISLRHDQFFHLLQVLLSLRELSLVGNSLLGNNNDDDDFETLLEEEEEIEEAEEGGGGGRRRRAIGLLSDSRCSPKLFLSRLANSTPSLTQLDLSYIDCTSETVDLRRGLVERFDWSFRWSGLRVIGLRKSSVLPRSTVGQDSQGQARGGGAENEVKEGRELGSETELDKDNFRKELRSVVASKRKRGKWIEVVV